MFHFALSSKHFHKRSVRGFGSVFCRNLVYGPTSGEVGTGSLRFDVLATSLHLSLLAQVDQSNVLSVTLTWCSTLASAPAVG